MKRMLTKIILSLLLLSSDMACSQKVCPQIVGLDPLLISGKLIMLGEMHGTREAPSYVEHISCSALQKGLAVTIFLELPQSDQVALDTFLGSDGSMDSKRKFLGLNFWSRSYQDGRASQAMFELINSVRALKRSGKLIDIIFIDIQNSSNRDLTMAERILKEMNMKPNNLFVSLTGNIHNRISKGSGRMGSYVLEKLSQHKVVSLNQSYSGGSAWVCLMNEGCGAVELRGSGRRDIGVFVNDNMSDYNGIFAMDSIHASFPAKSSIAIKE